MSIGKALSEGFGKLLDPHVYMTRENVADYNMVLCVGDTTFQLIFVLRTVLIIVLPSNFMLSMPQK